MCVYVLFTRGVISGAITSQYLLEKSRIVFQVKNLVAHTFTHPHSTLEGVVLQMSHSEKEVTIDQGLICQVLESQYSAAFVHPLRKIILVKFLVIQPGVLEKICIFNFQYSSCRKLDSETPAVKHEAFGQSCWILSIY